MPNLNAVDFLLLCCVFGRRLLIFYCVFSNIVSIHIISLCTNFRISNIKLIEYNMAGSGRVRLKCDGTRAETRFLLSAKRTSPFKSAGSSVHSNTGSRGVRISGSNAGYTMLRSSVKSTGYPLHSPLSPSLPLSSVTVCHHILTGLC